MTTSEGPGPKKHLGKIMLQQKLVTQNDLDGLLDDQQKRGGRLASAAAREGKVTVTEALRVLSEQHGVPAIDLSRQVVPLSNLKLMPVEIARERVVFPVSVQGEQLILAMASPQDQTSAEEVEFLAAKKVLPHVALDEALREAIEEGYALLDRGEPYYVGARVRDDELAQLGIARPLGVDGGVVTPLADEELVSLPGAEAAPPPEPQIPAAVVYGRAPETSGPQLDQAFAAPPRPASQPLVPTGYQGKQVLVVEDDDDIRRLVRLALTSAGVPVSEAADGSAALERLHDAPPDVLVLDAVLPGVHGFEICRRLRGSARYGEIPIVIVSAVHRGWRVAEDLREAYGVQHLFDKPIDLPRLTRTVRQLLEGKEVTADSGPLSEAARAELTAGMSAFESGDVGAAIVHLQAGVRIDPLAFELQYHLGLLHGRRDELFSAIDALEGALGIEPRNFSALKNLAVVYQRAGFRHKALELWERALANATEENTRANIKDHMMTLL